LYGDRKENMKLPKRKGLISMPMPKDATEVKSVTRIGGYYYWNWKFPFRHFEKERLLIVSKNCIYEAV